MILLYCADNCCKWFNQNMYFRPICFFILVPHFLGLGVLNITPQELKASKKTITKNKAKNEAKNKIKNKVKNKTKNKVKNKTKNKVKNK